MISQRRDCDCTARESQQCQKPRREGLADEPTNGYAAELFSEKGNKRRHKNPNESDEQQKANQSNQARTQRPIRQRKTHGLNRRSCTCPIAAAKSLPPPSPSLSLSLSFSQNERVAIIRSNRRNLNSKIKLIFIFSKYLFFFKQNFKIKA